MTSDDFVKLLAQSGTTGVLLFILGRVTWAVANRMIAAIDRVGGKIDEHTAKDLAAHSLVDSRLSRIEGKIGERHLTPVEGVPIVPPRRRTNPQGWPVATDRPPRRGTHHDEED